MAEARKTRKPAKRAAQPRKRTQAARPARRASASAPTRRSATRKKATKGKRAAVQDSKGGLTAQGRAYFHEREGANLKPGVQKPESEMSTSEMMRKGSWATRFYGRKELPRLTDEHQRPTRFALSAAAWGELVPRTLRAARRIAAKGRRLLARGKARQARGER